MTTSRPLSGTRVDLAAHGYTASIASVGATLRSLTLDGRELIVPFAADEARPAFRGAILVPWPNRVVDGRYTLDGHRQQLALTEPDRGHALHGLVTWLDFAIESQSDAAVTLTARLEAQQGYPASLAVTVTYELGERGLRTIVEAEHLGGASVPYGVAPHPYLVAGDGLVDAWTLSLPASEALLVDAERLIPQSLAAVGEHGFDFREPREIGDLFIDHAFTGLVRDADGTATVLATAADGHGAGVRWGAELPWVQVHTGDRPDAPELSRIGLAVEPMTCPPDAFNSGTDLVVLAPGEHTTASWELFGF